MINEKIKITCEIYYNNTHGATEENQYIYTLTEYIRNKYSSIISEHMIVDILNTCTIKKYYLETKIEKISKYIIEKINKKINRLNVSADVDEYDTIIYNILNKLKQKILLNDIIIETRDFRIKLI